MSILGLVAIKDARDIESRLNEVEKFLKAIISMPCKVRGVWARPVRLPVPACWPPSHLSLPERRAAGSWGEPGRGRLLGAPAAPCFPPRGKELSRRSRSPSTVGIWVQKPRGPAEGV